MIGRHLPFPTCSVSQQLPGMRCSQKKIRVTGRMTDATHFAMFDAWITAARVWVARLKLTDVSSDETACASSDLSPGASFYPEGDANIAVRLPNYYNPVIDATRQLWPSKDARPSATVVDARCANCCALVRYSSTACTSSSRLMVHQSGLSMTHRALICGDDATTAWREQLVCQIRPPEDFVSP